MVGSVSLSDINFKSELDKWIGDDVVYWNEDRKAWVVTGYDEVSRVLKDPKSFWRDAPERDGSLEFWGRHLMNLKHSDHRRMHAVHMKLTNEDFAKETRQSANKICQSLAKKLVERGHAELSTEYADAIPMLIGCDYLGFDISDEEFVQALRKQLDIRAVWKEALHAGDGISIDSEIAQNGLEALKNIKKLLLPTIRARREVPKDDLISALWREGPKVFSDWNEEDIINTCWSSMDNEGKPFQRGLLCLLCDKSELQTRLRANPELIEGFVEEGLRFLAPFRTLIRTAQRDVVLANKNISSGDTVYVITALANRDDKKWNHPYDLDIDRPQDVTHFTFGFGTCYCVGRYVGRMEAQASVDALLANTSSIRLDPNKPHPEWSGEVYHAAYPVHAILTPK